MYEMERNTATASCFVEMFVFSIMKCLSPMPWALGLSVLTYVGSKCRVKNKKQKFSLVQMNRPQISVKYGSSYLSLAMVMQDFGFCGITCSRFAVCILVEGQHLHHLHHSWPQHPKGSIQNV